MQTNLFLFTGILSEFQLYIVHSVSSYSQALAIIGGLQINQRNVLLNDVILKLYNRKVFLF